MFYFATFMDRGGTVWSGGGETLDAAKADLDSTIGLADMATVSKDYANNQQELVYFKGLPINVELVTITTLRELN